VWSIALSPNVKTVASGSRDGTIRLWDIETKKVVARWTRHTDVASSLCWSVDGERMVSGSNDGTMRVWDVESDDTVLGPIKTGHQYVLAVMYSPDTTKIHCGNEKMTGSRQGIDRRYNHTQTRYRWVNLPRSKKRTECRDFRTLSVLWIEVESACQFETS